MKSRIGAIALALLALVLIVAGCSAAAAPAQDWPGLTVAGGRVYLVDGLPQRQVYILDAETGASLDTFLPEGQHGGTLNWSPVTIGDDGTAFVGFSAPADRLYGLYAFDPATGDQLWRFDADDLILAAPTVADGTVYFGTSSGRVYAVDIETHTVLPGWPFETGEAIWDSPYIAGGRLYVASMDHYLYALDATGGQLVWKFQADSAIASQPQLDGDRLYQGAFDARVHALSAASGTPLDGFHFEAGNWIWSPVLVTEDRLFVTSLDGKLYALDPASGDVLPGYPYQVPAADYLRAAPVAADDLVIVASGLGRVIALKAETGQVQWQWPGAGVTPAGGILSNPVVAGGRVYFIVLNPQGHQIYALDAANGGPVTGSSWPFTPPAEE